MVKIVGIAATGMVAGWLYYVSQTDVYFPKVIAPVTQLICVVLAITSVLL